jgi:hypothetical protein
VPCQSKKHIGEIFQSVDYTDIIGSMKRKSPVGDTEPEG